MAARRVVRPRGRRARRDRRRGAGGGTVAVVADRNRPRPAPAQRAGGARSLTRGAQFLAAGRISGRGHRHRGRRRVPAVVASTPVSPPARPGHCPGPRRAVARSRSGPAAAASRGRPRRAGGGGLRRRRAGVAGGWPGRPRPPVRHCPGHGGMAYLARGSAGSGRTVAEPVPTAGWPRRAAAVERRPGCRRTGAGAAQPTRRDRPVRRAAAKRGAHRHPAGRCPGRHRGVA